MGADDVIALEFSEDIDTPNRYQTSDGEWHTGRIPTEHIEMIIDYIIDGSDYQYNDNHGILVRCRDCKYFKNGHLCEYFSQYGTIEMQEDDYCSRAEK